MGLKIYSIGSSSSGNSYIVASEDTALLLDAGLSGRRIKQGIAEAGLSAADVQGILVTHDHIDHAKSVNMMAKECPTASVIASRGTMLADKYFGKIADERRIIVAAGDTLAIGDIEIDAFALSHDTAEPISFTFSSGGDILTVVTDTGIITPEQEIELARANKIVLESNHEEEMVLHSDRPYDNKLRVLGDQGHLSNKSAAAALAQAINSKRDAGDESKTCVLLIHLSKDHNTAELALSCAEEALAQHGYERDVDYSLVAAPREGLVVLE